jgi:hypothetical protein
MKSERAIGIGYVSALILAGWFLIRVVGCPHQGTATFTEADIQGELARQHLTARVVPDLDLAARGAVILRTAVGTTGFIAVLWPVAATQLNLIDDPRWGSRLTPGYLRETLNVRLYALRGGSESEKARVRVTLSRMVRHLVPARPLACQDE